MDEIKLEACVEEALGMESGGGEEGGQEGGELLRRGLFNSASSALV